MILTWLWNFGCKLRGRDVHQIPFFSFPSPLPLRPPPPLLCLCDLFFNRISSAHFGRWWKLYKMSAMDFLSTHLFGFGFGLEFGSQAPKLTKLLSRDWQKDQKCWQKAFISKMSNKIHTNWARGGGGGEKSERRWKGKVKILLKSSY
jgi:hypothetical protein